MEWELRFGLDLGRLAVLQKRDWADYEQLLRVFFSCFQGQKIIQNFFLMYCSVRIKKLHQMKVVKTKANFKI